MRRFVLELAMIVTCVVAAVANVALAHYAGFNLFGLTLWFIIPVGALIVGAVAASGAIVAARLLDIRPSLWQSIISATLAIGLVIEAMRKIASSRIGFCAARSAMPCACR